MMMFFRLENPQRLYARIPAKNWIFRREIWYSPISWATMRLRNQSELVTKWTVLR